MNKPDDCLTCFWVGIPAREEYKQAQIRESIKTNFIIFSLLSLPCETSIQNEFSASELLLTRGTFLFIQGQAKTRTCFNRKWRNILGVLHILFIHMTCHHDLNFIRVSEKKIQNYFNALRKTEVNVESLFFFFKIRFNNSIYWIVWSLFYCAVKSHISRTIALSKKLTGWVRRSINYHISPDMALFWAHTF